MKTIIPNKLQDSDLIRVISPARSLAIISLDSRKIADQRLQKLGLKLSFSKNVEVKDEFASSSIKQRIEDIHDAFSDPKVKMIITTIGGYNSNQLLPYLDYALIKSNPKIICGYSDITALNTAIYSKTGIITYYGPHYSSFGEKLYFDYSLEYFQKCLLDNKPFEIMSSKKWSNDSWYRDQDNRKLITNPGLKIFNQGMGEGVILGGNQRTFHYLAGTEYFPSLRNKFILFLEEDSIENIYHFDSHLTALSQLPNFNNIQGLVIGRFEVESNVDLNLLSRVVKNNEKLKNVPIIYGVDFGHTDPKITFPIGGTARIQASDKKSSLEILMH